MNKNCGKKSGETNRPPKITRVLEELRACKKARRDDTRLQKKLKMLFSDPRELDLAKHWQAQLDRLPFLLDVKKRSLDATNEAQQRKDLTIAERLELYMALNEKIRRIAEDIEEELENEDSEPR